MHEPEESLSLKAARVKRASRELARVNTARKDQALLSIAEIIEKNREVVRTENNKDIAAGKKKGLSEEFIDRLTLDNRRIHGLINILHDVVNLKDPVGEIFNMNALPNGLKVGQIRVPIVIGIIFESRPNAASRWPP
jgi:glutamate-5-semialdehyde dehydrogenase